MKNSGMSKVVNSLLLLLGIVAGANAQERETVAVAAPGTQEALTLYDSVTVESQHLYNGPQYYIYDSQADEHQFFETREWSTGWVVYDGQRFDGVPLLYDIARQQVVARYKTGYGNVALQSPKVSAFALLDHQFVRVEADTGRVEGLRTGFYDQLYAGKSRVVARRAKERIEELIPTKIIPKYPQKDVFYIYKNGEYQPIRTRRALLTLFEDQKRIVKREIRQRRLSFRQDREAMILAAAARYDQLTATTL